MLQEESEKDIDISKKQIGSEFKSFIKKSSGDYLVNLKTELMKGFKTYFDQLNGKIAEECQLQETQQKGLIDKIEKAEEKSATQIQIVSKRKNIIYKEKVTLVDLNFKMKAFNMLKFVTQRMNQMSKKKATINQIVLNNKTRKIFSALKELALSNKTTEYDEKLKNQTKAEIEKLQLDFKKQKEEMLVLISKAQEKLKHENRKKIQVKLLLDQMVLRGISALNLQAMDLSNNSLKEVVKSDYNKEIDMKYQTMLFPETKTKAITKLK